MAARLLTLVVGGSGCLGGWVVRALLAAGERVRVMSRQPASLSDMQLAGAEVAAGDLLDASSLRRACIGVSRVVASAHSLLGKGKNRSEMIDGAGHHSLIDIAQELEVQRIVYVSAYGARPDHPIPFARFKADVEKHLGATNLPHTIVRPTLFMDFHAEELIGRRIRNGETVWLGGHGDNPQNFVAASDVARFVLLGLGENRPRSETIDVGGPENLTRLEVVRIYEEALAVTARVRCVPLAVLGAARALIGQVHEGVGQAILCTVVSEMTDQTFDCRAMIAQHGVRPTTLASWLRSRVGPDAPEPATPPP